jgi:hypothetical protein
MGDFENWRQEREKIGIVVAYNLPTGQKYGNLGFFAKLETEV